MIDKKLIRVQNLLYQIKDEKILEQVDKLLDGLSDLSLKDQTQVISKAIELVKGCNNDE